MQDAAVVANVPVSIALAQKVIAPVIIPLVKPHAAKKSKRVAVSNTSKFTPVKYNFCGGVFYITYLLKNINDKIKYIFFSYFSWTRVGL